jgi:hypothetical protein
MSSTRSKLYERYNVELPPSSSSKANSSGNKFIGWLKSYTSNKEEDEARRQQLPIEEWTNVEMFKYILKNASFKSKLIAILVILILSSIIISSVLYPKNVNKNDLGIGKKNSGGVMTKYGLRPDNMPADSHERSNPFAPPDHTSYLEGVLEVKRIGKKKKNDDPPPPPPPPVQENSQQQEGDDTISKTKDKNILAQREKDVPPVNRSKKKGNASI